MKFDLMCDFRVVFLCVRSLQQTYEAKRQEFLVELQRREDEMRQMFVQRVKEKESELKEAEREVCRPTGTGSRHLVAVFSLTSIQHPTRSCTFSSSAPEPLRAAEAPPR